MKSLVLILSILITSITQSFAQDVLMFLNGNEEEVKITEVSSSEVKYKRINNLEGPTFSTLKSELFMIKYANGDKEMIEHTTAAPEPQSNKDAMEEEYITEDASDAEMSNPNQPVVAPITSVANTDQWGRNEAENRRLHKKKIKQGAVLMGVGAITVGVGGTLLYLGNVNNSTSTVGPEDGVNRSVPTVALGVVGIVGGSAMLVSGAILLGVSSKYKKRAEQLANGSASITPSMINIRSFSGSSIHNQTGYGVTFSYKF